MLVTVCDAKGNWIPKLPSCAGRFLRKSALQIFTLVSTPISCYVCVFVCVCVCVYMSCFRKLLLPSR